VRTGFGKNSKDIWRLLTTLGGPFFRSPERGARSLVWLALADEAGELTGAYIQDEEVAPAPKPATRSSPRGCGSTAKRSPG
jgi:hypothetical protein